MKRFYGLMAIIGTVAPWFYFGSYFADGDRETFGDALFASPLMVGFVADLSISIVVLLAWSFVDSRRNQISRWWLVPIASLTVGLSLALPLYLYLREPAGGEVS